MANDKPTGSDQGDARGDQAQPDLPQNARTDSSVKGGVVADGLLRESSKATTSSVDSRDSAIAAARLECENTIVRARSARDTAILESRSLRDQTVASSRTMRDNAIAAIRATRDASIASARDRRDKLTESAKVTATEKVKAALQRLEPVVNNEPQRPRIVDVNLSLREQRKAAYHTTLAALAEKLRLDNDQGAYDRGVFAAQAARFGGSDTAPAVGSQRKTDPRIARAVAVEMQAANSAESRHITAANTECDRTIRAVMQVTDREIRSAGAVCDRTIREANHVYETVARAANHEYDQTVRKAYLTRDAAIREIRKMYH